MVCPKFYVGLDESGPLCSDFSVTKGAVRGNLKEWFNLRADLGVLTGRCATHSVLVGFADFILPDAARLHERSITHEDFELPKVICSASGNTTSFDLSHARASDARGVLVLDARCNLKSYCAKRWKDLYTAMRPSNVSAYLSVWSSSTLEEEGRLCPRSNHGELSLPLSGETLQPCHHYDNGRLGAEASPRGSSAYRADGDLFVRCFTELMRPPASTAESFCRRYNSNHASPNGRPAQRQSLRPIEKASLTEQRAA